MSDLFLIAHKVRGEPAFDVAERAIFEDGEDYWIVSTSGHKAYPYWVCELSKLGYVLNADGSVPNLIGPMPLDLPDHYPTRCSPKDEQSSGKSLLAKLGLIPKIVRRL